MRPALSGLYRPLSERQLLSPTTIDALPFVFNAVRAGRTSIWNTAVQVRSPIAASAGAAVSGTSSIETATASITTRLVTQAKRLAERMVSSFESACEREGAV